MSGLSGTLAISSLTQHTVILPNYKGISLELKRISVNIYPDLPTKSQGSRPVPKEINFCIYCKWLFCITLMYISDPDDRLTFVVFGKLGFLDMPVNET